MSKGVSVSDYIQRYQKFVHQVFPASELREGDTVVVCPSKYGAEDAYEDEIGRAHV